MTKYHFFFSLLFAMSWVPLLAQQKVSNAQVTFKIKNAGFWVTGKLGGFQGEIQFDANNLAQSSLTASVDARTIDTDNSLRNRHLKEKSEFFDVAKYPSISMKSTKLEKTSTGFSGTFLLTMKGVTQAVNIPFTVSKNAESTTLSGTFSINRRDWKVGGSSFLMSDTAVISLQVTFQ
jgi:polyisoprenoid-binding protein YceI